jgi:glycosyltransferase involved in cell wall biosynthesis
MSEPKVTFVIPCYKLAHLLAECVNSVLAQTFGDFEILIMDDASPDHTAEVARSFTDPRVRHIRNDPNLGHLRNYNKGIGMARGKYVWLISADDYLRSPKILERYVQLMEREPRVGFCYCPGIGVKHGKETRLLDYTVHGAGDRVTPGHELLKHLLYRNTILAPSGLARKECYEKLGLFPLDMPWAGDWYIWGLFALHYDVGYFAEPMVCYREHELSMTTKLWRENVVGCVEEDVAVPWAIKRKADAAGFKEVARDCLRAVARTYSDSMLFARYSSKGPALTLDQFESSLSQSPADDADRRWVRARIYEELGNAAYWKGDRMGAREHYREARRQHWWMPSVIAKQMLLFTGGAGHALRLRLKPKA